MAAVTPVQSPVKLEASEFGETVSYVKGRPDYSVNDRLGTPSGFTGYTINEMRVTQLWKQLLNETFKLYGFTEMDPPPVEHASNLQLTGGLDKQIFGVSRLQDGTLTKLGLPFDRTVPMAILIARNHLTMSFPYSRSDIGWSWRGEHAQLGRYRAFIQADVDTIAPTLSPLADAQCIVAIIKGLEKLGVPGFNVIMNHVEIAKSFLKEEGIAPTQFNDVLRVIDKLKPYNEPEVVKELAEVVNGFNEERASALLVKMRYQGPLSAFNFSGSPSEEGLAGFEHLRKIEEMVIRMGIQPGVLQFATSLTRGLNYYTGVVFETFMPGREKYGSIASGGRYDNLVGEFNKNLSLQGVGGSIGLTRLFDAMKVEEMVDLSKQTSAQVFVGYRTDAQLSTAIALSTALRDRGIYTEMNLTIPKVKKQLEFADKKGFPLAIIVFNDDEIVLKDISTKKTSEEQTPQLTFGNVEQAALKVLELKNSGRFGESV
jgi:histidyl-tRNA synthetase